MQSVKPFQQIIFGEDTYKVRHHFIDIQFQAFVGKTSALNSARKNAKRRELSYSFSPFRSVFPIIWDIVDKLPHNLQLNCKNTLILAANKFKMVSECNRRYISHLNIWKSSEWIAPEVLINSLFNSPDVTSTEASEILKHWRMLSLFMLLILTRSRVDPYDNFPTQ